MSIDPQLRSLNIDIPACPHTLVKLSLMMGNENAQTDAMAELIEGDMALASAIVRTVNSALFGLLHRVETVHEAVRYLGMREVSGITYEMGLRAAFPPGPLIDRIWDRASRRGLAMGRAAQALDLPNPWAAHTAGLFAESGRAVLYAYDRERYTQLEERASSDDALIAAEVAAFGVSHAALGAALCQSWGLASEVGAFVRARPASLDDWAREPLEVRRLLAIGAEIDTALEPAEVPNPQGPALSAQRAELAELEIGQLCDALQRVCEVFAQREIA
ncbi:MAG: HDOD domain-containing protein [Aquabacterium sp.]|jgi:HD-like signal output (HDOD) protein|nr:MAG: HDOD domain-containing protein [Aquabacterium sp.]